MIADSGARLELKAAVASLEQDAEGVVARTQDGRRFAAKAALIATGLNPMAGLGFAPALPQDKAAAIGRGHLGRAVKVWAKVAGVGVGILATGGGDGLEWMFSERRARDGATMIVGFGIASAGFDPRGRATSSRPWRASSRKGGCSPSIGTTGSRIRFARGTWVASRLGAEGDAAAATWRRAGRLAFASSDFASSGAGWFDAAAISGAEAAQEIARAAALELGYLKRHILSLSPPRKRGSRASDRAAVLDSRFRGNDRYVVSTLLRVRRRALLQQHRVAVVLHQELGGFLVAHQRIHLVAATASAWRSNSFFSASCISTSFSWSAVAQHARAVIAGSR